MLSPLKIIVLAGIIVGVWYAFRWLNRIGVNKSQRLRKKSREQRAAEIEDMVRCPVCDTYVPAGQLHDCDRPDCPSRDA